MPLPGSLPWMESVDAKVARADELINLFASDVRDFARTVRPHAVRKHNDHSTWLVVWLDDPYPPLRLSAVFGDCLYNLRSALDSLICGLVRIGSPHHDCARREFPIFLTEAKYDDDSPPKIKGVPDAAKALIRSCQPWNRPPGSELLEPLWLLHTLNIQDKHRSINLIASYTRHVVFQIPLRTGAVLEVRSGRDEYDLSPERIPLPVHPSLIDEVVRIGAQGTSVLTIRDAEMARGRQVTDVADTCLKRVKEIVRMLRPFFEPKV